MIRWRIPEWGRAVFRVLRREVSRFAGNKVYLFVSLTGPLLSFVLVVNIFIAGVPSGLPVAVVDSDNTSVSRQLVRMVDATRTVRVYCKLSSLHEGNEAVLRGDAQAVLHIPAGFGKSVMKSEGPGVVLYINNTNVLNGGLLQSAVLSAVSTYSTGVKLQIAMKGGSAPEQALEQVYSLRLDTHELFNPYINYSYFLSSALMPLLIALFTLLGAIYAIGIEIREGTSDGWMKAANGSIMVALTGKLVPYTLLMLVNVGVMHYILANYIGFPVKGWWGSTMAAQVLMIIAYQMVAVVLVALTANTRLSLSLASAYSMMAFTYSGLTFPVLGMPLIARIIAYIFPFYHWMRVFMGQSLRNEPLATAVGPMLGLIAFIIIGILFFPRLNYVLSEPRFQHRT